MKIKVYTIEFKTPRWLKRTFAFVVVPGIVLLGVGAIVRAAGVPTLTSFSPGDSLSSANINANFKALQDVVNGTDGATVVNAVNATNAATATSSASATSASSLSCSGCVRTAQLATGAISLGRIRIAVGSTTPNPIAGVYYYAGGDCVDGTEILVGGACNGSYTGQALVT